MIENQRKLMICHQENWITPKNGLFYASITDFFQVFQRSYASLLRMGA